MLTVRLQGGDQQIAALGPDGIRGDGGGGEGGDPWGAGGAGGGRGEVLCGLRAVEERSQGSLGSEVTGVRG